MAWTRGTIDGGSTVNHTDSDDIHIAGKIDGGSSVNLTSTGGSIIIDGKVDGGSDVTLRAVKVIRIGFAGNDDGEKKIDGNSNVDAHAGEDISVGHKIDNNSRVTLVSDLGSITIGGKIDHDSVVSLTAAGNIRIGEAGNDGGERKIDGNSEVGALAGGTIHLFNKIDGGSLSGKHSTVKFRACRGITIDDKIDGGSVVFLAVSTGEIDIGDKIGGGGTTVTVWPPNVLRLANGIDNGGTLTVAEWTNPSTWCTPGPSGYYWRNWPQQFGYVCVQRFYPRSVDDISTAIQISERYGNPVKAVGGAWSFSDASLPMKNQSDVDAISIMKRGADGTEDFSHVLQGLNGITNSPVDLQPENVSGDLSLSTHYDQVNLSQLTDSGANLPLATSASIIDMRGLASSLQDQLFTIMSDTARAAVNAGPGGKPPPSTHYFHVEAGIVMADLDQLLDHQLPRLANQASGGSVGATLAGALSSATHGAEFRWPLLVDRVRAIHFVGPGGQQWWIEGDKSIADLTRLQTIYPQIDAQHFIAGGKRLGRVGAQDVLNALIVSMGTMGVIYSVVLEVVPQFGLQQISKAFPGVDAATGWTVMLGLAGTSEDALRNGDSAANQAVLRFLLDGSKNGTGIPFRENVFCDLAINPLNLDCWVMNRRVTPQIPIDSNRTTLDLRSALSETLGGVHAVADHAIEKNRALGRIFDFLGWATDVPDNPVDAINDFLQAIRLGMFLGTYPDVLTASAAIANVQAVANVNNAGDYQDRGLPFLADAVSGFLNASQGTIFGALGDTTDVSYKLGVAAWPTDGIPGRGLEIALPPDAAFTFLQSVLFDDVRANTIVLSNKPLIGYISVRVCPPTNTLMGMQQFSPFSIMIEIVSYRSPEANEVMDLIQTSALDRNANPLNAMLHWGLENDQMNNQDLARMPVAHRPLTTFPQYTRLSAFRQVRQLLIDGHFPSPFENNFVSRLDL